MFQLIAQSGGGSSAAGLLIPFVLLGGLFYFMILRPQQRRQRAQQELINAISEGDEIITTAGIYGVVMSIDDEEGTVTVAIAPGTEIKLLRAGIGRRVTVDEDYEDYDEDQDEEQDDEQDAGDEDTSDGPDQPGQIKEL
jgi:preprotein translocase subunit YajC